MFSRGVTEGCCKAIEDEVQILRVHDPGKYLGLPSVWGCSKKKVLGYINNGIRDKINGWRTKNLNQARKEVLIKVVIT